MASTGYLLSLINALPETVKRPLTAFTNEAFKTLRFGAPSSGAVAAENFGGHLVPFTTSSVSNNEVAVAHALGRVPRLLISLLPLDTVNATMPVITVTKAADSTYFYVKSATTSASMWAYVE